MIVEYPNFPSIYPLIAEAANSLCLTLRAFPEDNEKKSGSFRGVADMIELWTVLEIGFDVWMSQQ
jgi:hypothetical protein